MDTSRILGSMWSNLWGALTSIKANLSKECLLYGQGSCEGWGTEEMLPVQMRGVNNSYFQLASWPSGRHVLCYDSYAVGIRRFKSNLYEFEAVQKTVQWGYGEARGENTIPERETSRRAGQTASGHHPTSSSTLSAVQSTPALKGTLVFYEFSARISLS